MTKYKEYVDRMLAENKELFEHFREVHDEYALNPDSHQEEFNREGEKVMPVIKDYENRLCMQSEKGGYGHFTANLAEKFQEEIKKVFPKIDHVGLIVNKFSLKKISLN